MDLHSPVSGESRSPSSLSASMSSVCGVVALAASALVAVAAAAAAATAAAAVAVAATVAHFVVVAAPAAPPAAAVAAATATSSVDAAATRQEGVRACRAGAPEMESQLSTLATCGFGVRTSPKATKRLSCPRSADTALKPYQTLHCPAVCTVAAPLQQMMRAGRAPQG